MTLIVCCYQHGETKGVNVPVYIKDEAKNYKNIKGITTEMGKKNKVAFVVYDHTIDKETGTIVLLARPENLI